MHEAKQDGAPVAELFRGGRARATLLLWGINFPHLLNLFFLANRLPTLAVPAGYSAHVAVAAGTLLRGGRGVGTGALGPRSGRVGFWRRWG